MRSKYNLYRKIPHFIAGSRYKMFLQCPLVKLQQCSRFARRMQIAESGIFNTVKEHDLSFDILNDFEEKFSLLLFGFEFGVLGKKFFYNFFRTFPLFITNFAFFIQKRQQHPDVGHFIVGQTHEK